MFSFMATEGPNSEQKKQSENNVLYTVKVRKRITAF